MSTPKITITNSGLEAVPADVVVIGTTSTEDGVAIAEGTEQVDAAFGGKLTGVLSDLGASGKVGETIKVATLGTLRAPVVLATGMGEVEREGPTQEQVRRACGAAARALSGSNRVAIALSALDVQGAVEGALLGGYRPAGKDSVLSALDLVVSGDRKAARATIKAATAIAEAVCTARDLINTPPNHLYPETFAARAKQIGEDAGLSVEVLDEKALRRKGYGGVLGVGDGSARKPRLVRLSHKPAKAKARVALVGKGITFDTGGISLKPPAKMDEMTSDMSGAAVVVAAVALAARLNYPLEVTATVPMAENMPSGSAYRPGDVLTMYGGTTVEVLNTDAEGRLVLADAIVRACEDKPDYLIETSTLTGAQLIALGARTAGIMGSAEFRDRVAGLARACGEGGWAMPLPEELHADIETPLADMTNYPTGAKTAGMLLAGVFLSKFVGEQVPWAHLDVAGPAYNAGAPWGYTGKGGTGVPLRTIAAVLADIAENG